MKKFQNLGAIMVVFMFFSCTKSDVSTENNNNLVSEDLHFSFKTPDWERYVNCNDLTFDGNFVNDSTSSFSFSSQSTNATVCFSYPKDSSKIVKTKLLKSHKIKEIYYNDEPFQFSLKLDLDANHIGTSDKRMGSSDGSSATEYNQVTEIKYIGSDKNNATFRVKCKYEMKMYLFNDPTTIKPVSGNFTFNVKTTKK